MTQIVHVNVPDVGDFKDIPIIEILVKPGDSVAEESPLVTLETDKATMEIPSPCSGVIKEIKVSVNDKVSQGSLLLTLETESTASPSNASSTSNDGTSTPFTDSEPIATQTTQAKALPESDFHAEVVVLGAGPGGYTAAFRAADLGKQVIMIERYPTLGGVCLNVGCIPSKALLHAAKTITEAEDISEHGITFGQPEISIDKLRHWKESVIGKLTKGLKALAKQRKVDIIPGTGKFTADNMISVETADGTKTVSFDHCIIAAGSSVARIPGFPYEDPRIIDSTGALQLADIPKRMLVIGGGIIGLEMASVYAALGSKISIVELMDQLIPGADSDLVKPLHRRIQKRYEAIYLKTKVSKIEPEKMGLKVTFEGDKAPDPQIYDRVLMAVGRRPNGRDIGAELAGIHINERGFIPVDQHQRTNVPNIYGIGDIVGEPMLAHKATYEGKLAAEIIAGHKAA
ncbi:MAG: FAD-dependent oxidoreductase, partial [Nitrosomonas sp.]|nr:FAD-dependent oxidoreductase [Nitrosomonas sp.]